MEKTKPQYRLIDVGRGKFSGIVTAQSDEQEHIEHAILGEAGKHLMSHDLDLDGDTEGGTILAGFRTVGKYERVH